MQLHASERESCVHTTVDYSVPHYKIGFFIFGHLVDPHLSKDILELESVQHFAYRVYTKSWDIPYCDMLSTLNIPPL